MRSLTDFIEESPWSGSGVGSHHNRLGPGGPSGGYLSEGWGLLVAKSGDFCGHQRGPQMAITGDFLVATDIRWVYEAESPREARSRLERFYELARIAGTPEVLRLAKTIKRWEPEVLSFFTTGRTNARSEAMNLVTEKLRRNAHGIRNFENYRLRLLLHSGVQWNTQPTARIRGRHPRLSA